MTAAIRERFHGPLPDPLPDPPTHCQSCGRALIYREEQDSYRPSDGTPLVTPTWRCPVTVGWWNRLSMRFITHDEYDPDHFGKWYWRKRDYR